MRFNQKSDVQKHFSNKHRPTFLHQASTENHAPNDRTDIARREEPRLGVPVVIAAENIFLRRSGRPLISLIVRGPIRQFAS